MNEDKQLLGPLSREYLQSPAGHTYLSPDGKSREMTLEEWIDILPQGHRARLEFAEMEIALFRAQVRCGILGFFLGLVIISNTLYFFTRFL